MFYNFIFSKIDFQAKYQAMSDSGELFDVLDHKGNKTGIIRTRKEIHSRGLFHRVVHTWIGSKNGKLLMQLRDKGILSIYNTYRKGYVPK